MVNSHILLTLIVSNQMMIQVSSEFLYDLLMLYHLSQQKIHLNDSKKQDHFSERINFEPVDKVMLEAFVIHALYHFLMSKSMARIP